MAGAFATSATTAPGTRHTKRGSNVNARGGMPSGSATCGSAATTTSAMTTGRMGGIATDRSGALHAAPTRA